MYSNCAIRETLAQNSLLRTKQKLKVHPSYSKPLEGSGQKDNMSEVFQMSAQVKSISVLTMH